MNDAHHLPWYSIYRFPRAYDLLMLALYKGNAARFDAVMSSIEPGARILDLCCGTGTLGRKLLDACPIAYHGIELNPGPVALARRRGLDVQQADVFQVDFPRVDHIVIMSSLYHFIGNVDVLLDRCQAAARIDVRVTEPIANVSQSAWPSLASLAARMCDAGKGPEGARFSVEQLRTIARARQAVRAEVLDGGREFIMIIPGKATERCHNSTDRPPGQPPHAP